MLYCEEAKHTLPSRGDTTRDSSVVYVLRENETEDEKMKKTTILPAKLCVTDKAAMLKGEHYIIYKKLFMSTDYTW